MKKRIVKLLSGVMLAAMLVTSVPSATLFAANKPNKAWASIDCTNMATDEWSQLWNVFDGDITKTKGMSYDKAKNTLTLNNVKNPDLHIELCEMGDDFKIKVVGKNELQSINSEGGSHGGSIKITGTGTLTVNKNRKADNAIRVYGRVIKSNLKVDEGVVLNLYKGSEDWKNAIQVEGKNKNGISISGVSKSAYIVENDWAQHTPVDASIAKSGVPCTLDERTDLADEKLYAFDDGDGYVICKKIGESSKGLMVCEEVDWKGKEDETLKLQEDGSVEAFLNSRTEYMETATRDGQEYALTINWDERTCDAYAIEEVEGVKCATFVEQTTLGDEDVAVGYEWIFCGNNAATMAKKDIFTVGKASISTVKAVKNGVNVSWKAVGGAKKYEVRYSTNKKMTGAKTVAVGSKKSAKITDLKSKVTVYVQVRGITVDKQGNTVCGAWSAVKSAKTK